MHQPNALTLLQCCLDLELKPRYQGIMSSLEHFGQEIDAPHVLFGLRGYSQTLKKPIEYALTNFSSDWKSLYDQKKYAIHDPFLRRARTSAGPFRFQDVKLEPSDEDYRLDLEAHGMSHGLICTTLKGGYIGLALFAGMTPMSDERWATIAPAAHLLTHALTRVAMAITDKTGEAPAPSAAEAEADVVLTDRERDCLEFAAQGETAKSIGHRLSISEHTVRFHLNRAADKLGAANPKEAVANALARNLIRKRHFGDPTFKSLTGG